MKLTKQERIGIFIIAIIIIIAVGIFMFIVPKAETIGESNKALDNKRAELTAAVEKQATKGPLKEQVLDAYDAGENLADMFFADMTTYQADMEFKKFVDQLESNVFIDEYSIGDPGTATLSTSFFNEKTVDYPLKIYATQGVEKTEEEIAAAARRDILMNTLGSQQVVGAITISLTVSAIDNEELLKFADEVNNYEVMEADGKTRKAVMLGGLSVTYKEISDEYDELKDKIEEQAEKEALAELKKNFPDADWDNEREDEPNPEDEKKKETMSVTDTIYELSTSLTFYSVTRMQDPTAQLDAQDGTAS
ncbi:MAG: hypothetical protein ACI4KM_04150 [Oscillospiraceae bacterium]